MMQMQKKSKYILISMILFYLCFYSCKTNRNESNVFNETKINLEKMNYKISQLRKYLLYSGVIVLFIIGILQFLQSDYCVNHFIQNTQEALSGQFFSGKDIIFKSQVLDESWNDSIETLFLVPIEYSEANMNQMDSVC
jgi:hypothetical protein